MKSKYSVIACTVVLSCMNAGHGQTRSSTLAADINPTASCPVSDRPLSIQDNGKDIRKASPDLSCGISAKDLASQLMGKAAVVDVRQKTAYELFHIDGALNWTPSGLVSKTYLKNQMVVLVGSGKQDEEVYSACSWLKAKGFSQTRVLKGGMASWSSSALPGVGTLIRDRDTSLDDQELFLHGQQTTAITLLLGGSDQFRAQLPNAISLTEASYEATRRILGKRKQSPISIALVGTQGQASDLAAKLRDHYVIDSIPVLTYFQPYEKFSRFDATREKIGRGPGKKSRSSCAN